MTSFSKIQYLHYFDIPFALYHALKLGSIVLGKHEMKKQLSILSRDNDELLVKYIQDGYCCLLIVPILISLQCPIPPPSCAYRSLIAILSMLLD